MSASAMLHTGRVILGAPARVAVSSPPVPSSLIYPTTRLSDCRRRIASHRLTRSETVPRPRSQQTRRHAKQSRQGRTVAAAADERAKLEQEYTFHSPGSVQETDDAVVFAHQTPGEAGKWKDASVFHVGDGSSDPVRLGVVIGEFHNVLMDRMLEDARVSAEAMGGRVDQWCGSRALTKRRWWWSACSRTMPWTRCAWWDTSRRDRRCTVRRLSLIHI